MLLKIENPTEEEMYQLEVYTSQVDYLEREVSLLEKRLNKDKNVNLLRK